MSTLLTSSIAEKDIGNLKAGDAALFNSLSLLVDILWVSERRFYLLEILETTLNFLM